MDIRSQPEPTGANRRQSIEKASGPTRTAIIADNKNTRIPHSGAIGRGGVRFFVLLLSFILKYVLLCCLCRTWDGHIRPPIPAASSTHVNKNFKKNPNNWSIIRKDNEIKHETAALNMSAALFFRPEFIFPKTKQTSISRMNSSAPASVAARFVTSLIRAKQTTVLVEWLPCVVSVT